MTQPRTLRSKRLRALLWQAADGKCSLCGVDLGDDWEADHIVPWRLTHRTNVHEMQALCRKCNSQKRGRMPIDLERAWSELRPGQVGAIKTVIDRLRAREAYTSVVLPTRYGKTDVARVALAYCLDARIVTACLFLTVNETLRGQAVKQDKWRECWTRCGITVPVKARVLKAPGVKYHANGEGFLSATIQLVQQNLPNFCAWAESVLETTGKPVVVMIDECHTGSEKNTWGQVAQQLSEHGALVVLLTATAMRSDGEMIYGFDWETVESEPEEWHTWRPAEDPERIVVDRWSGEKRRIKLRANWETTFRAAWREDPSPICKLSRVPFDISLLEVQSELNGVSRTGWLSEKSPNETRKLLGRFVRDSRAIREGAFRLVRELRLLRESEPSAAAIVFCGNDTEGGEDHANEHAKAIVREIGRQDSGLTCIVATSNQGEEAARAIQQFADANVGDVLVVKQMAGVGLDAPRIKVCLDLSSVRTAAACIQRWMRVATPFGRHTVGVLIAPADCLGKELFDVLVAGEGGAQSSRVGEVVLSYEKPKGPEKPEGDGLTLVDFTGDADFEDSLLNRAARDQQGTAYELCERFPMLLQVLSHAEIVAKVKGIRFEQDEEVAGASFADLTGNIEAEQDNIEAIAQDIVKARLRGVPYSKEAWGEAKRQVWSDFYRESGVSYRKGGLRHITDMRELTSLKLAAEQIRNQEVNDDDGNPG